MSIVFQAAIFEEPLQFAFILPVCFPDMSPYGKLTGMKCFSPRSPSSSS